MEEAVNPAERAHALLSASGASRWLACTPSARIEEKLEEDRDSSFANEGTLAHEFGDLGIKLESGMITNIKYNALVAEHLANDMHNSEMDEEVQKYIDYVIEAYNVARGRTKDAVLLVEEKVDLREYIEDSFGTCDANVIAEGTLEIIDLKYGKGIQVSAKDNPQLKLYALGALSKYCLAYDIDKVKLTIVQPRLNHVSSWLISVEDLEDWGEHTVKPKAKMAYAGEGLQCAGDHCRWCRAKAQCATFASQAMKAAKVDFQDQEKPKDIHLLTDDQLIEIFTDLSFVEMWIKAVKDHVEKEALKGKKWKGFKLVEGRSTRKWTDEELVGAKLLEEGFTKVQFINSKMKGIGDIEKLVKKSNFGALLGELVIKPAGKPTLVPNSDKRTDLAISAEDDFLD